MRLILLQLRLMPRLIRMFNVSPHAFAFLKINHMLLNIEYGVS